MQLQYMKIRVVRRKSKFLRTTKNLYLARHLLKECQSSSSKLLNNHSFFLVGGLKYFPCFKFYCLGVGYRVYVIISWFIFNHKKCQFQRQYSWTNFFFDNFLYFRRVRTRVKSINNTASIMTRIITRYHFHVKIKINRSRTCIQFVESHDNESCKYQYAIYGLTYSCDSF